MYIYLYLSKCVLRTRGSHNNANAAYQPTGISWVKSQLPVQVQAQALAAFGQSQDENNGNRTAALLCGTSAREALHALRAGAQTAAAAVQLRAQPALEL